MALRVGAKQTGNSTTPTPVKPAGLGLGDMIITHVSCQGTTTAPATLTSVRSVTSNRIHFKIATQEDVDGTVSYAFSSTVSQPWTAQMFAIPAAEHNGAAPANVVFGVSAACPSFPVLANDWAFVFYGSPDGTVPGTLTPAMDTVVQAGRIGSSVGQGQYTIEAYSRPSAAGTFASRSLTTPVSTYGITGFTVTPPASDTTPPTAISNLVATPTSSSLALTWTGSTDNVAVVGYEVKNGAGTVLSTAAATSYTRTGLAPSTTDTYTVRAYDAAGNFSSPVSVTSTTSADTTAPTAPGSLTATPGTNQIKLDWTVATDNVGVVAYDLYANDTGTGSPIASGLILTYTDTGLPASTARKYGVRARDAAGNVGPLSTVTTATLAPASHPSVVKNGGQYELVKNGGLYELWTNYALPGQAAAWHLGGRPPVAAPVAPELRQMFNSLHFFPPVGYHTVDATNTQSVGEQVGVTNDYTARNWTLFFPSWYVDIGGNASPEKDIANTLTVRCQVSFDNRATWREVLFPEAGGANEVIVPAGGFRRGTLSVPAGIPGGTVYYVRTFCEVAVGGRRPGGAFIKQVMPGYPTPNQQHPGCWYGSSRSSALSRLAGATLGSNANGDGSRYYGPALVTSDGWDGRRVVLMVGDSIGFLQSGRSWLVRGLDSPTGGRVPLWNTCVEATRPSQQSSIATGAYKHRDELIQAAASLNNGPLPFTNIVSEHGVNNSTTTGTEHVDIMRTFWAFLKSRYPGKPVTQTSLPPKTLDAGYGFTDYAHQTTSGTSRYSVNSALPAEKAAARIDEFVDLGAVWAGDSPNNRKWRVDGVPTGVLAAAYTGGNASIRTSIQVKQGDAVILDPGGAGKIPGGLALSVTDNGDGTWTSNFGGNTPSSTDLPAGTVVTVMASRDGIHPAENRQAPAMDLIVSRKSAGTLLPAGG